MPLLAGFLSVLFATAAGALGYWAVRNTRRAVLIDRTPTTPVSQVKNGLAEIKGHLAAAGEPLRSPVTNSECVYYHIRVEELSLNLGEEAWTTVVEDRQFSDCLVADGTGSIAVDLQSAELDVGSMVETDEAAPWYVRMIARERYHQPDLRQKVRYSEVILKTGTPVYVLGHASDNDGSLRMESTASQPLFVSAESENKLLSRYRRRAAMCWVTGAAAAASLSLLVTQLGF
ncbi:MAG: hypothetical protein KDA79_09760 [Planctomycetaceae bacterium]|nr:hypothetical protein [Planctomycetaceae bacterium]